MADTKVSLLTALTQAGMDPSNDLVPIVDSVGVITKNIKPKLLMGGAANDMAQTWDNAGTTFSAVKMNVTDTNSQAASLLMNLLVGGAGKFQVDKAGALVTQLVHPGTYGGIYVWEGSTAQVVATGTTPILLTCFNTAAGADGLSNDMTVVKASNKITVTRAGVYKAAWSLSYSSSVTNAVWEFTMYNGATQVVATAAMSKTFVAGDVQCVSGVGYMDVAASTDITLRGFHNQGGNASITVEHANLTLEYVGS